MPTFSAARSSAPANFTRPIWPAHRGRIGEQVGQRDIAVTANTYTHVLSDETELDYAALVVW